MVFGGPSEFKTRTDGLAGLKKNYGLMFKTFDPPDESGPLTLAALITGRSRRPTCSPPRRRSSPTTSSS